MDTSSFIYPGTYTPEIPKNGAGTVKEITCNINDDRQLRHLFNKLPGCEGMRSGVRGDEIRGARGLEPGCEGMRSGVRGD